MSIFGGVISVSNISTLLFVVFAVLALGYLLGRITIKGVSLGDAGVFIIALLCGALFFSVNDAGELLFAASSKPYDFSSGLSIIESLGLVLFVTSVGFIAGPKFFGNFKRNFKSFRAILRHSFNGVNDSYSVLALIKKVCLVCNLKPCKLCGVDSYGMILASGEDDVKVVFLDPSAKNGDRIH